MLQVRYKIENVDKFTDETYEFYYQQLNRYQKGKINKLKNKIDRKLSLLALVLIEKELHISLSKIKYRKRKPFIKNEFYVSISHKYPFVAVAVAQNPIGLDLEIIREIDCNTLQFLQAENNLDALIRWTRKESLFKIGKKNNIKYKTIMINRYLIFTICESNVNNL